MWKFVTALTISSVIVGLGYWYSPDRIICFPFDTTYKGSSSVSDLVLQSGHSLKPGENNGMIWIRGTVKNISRYRYLAVKVKFKLKDKANNIIPGGDVSAYVQSIEPNGEWEFKALMIDPDAVGYEPILPVEGSR